MILSPLQNKILDSDIFLKYHISSEALKDAMTTLPHHMLHIINLVITWQTFPDKWKRALVTPLPKGGDPTDVSNLRPISILPIPAKITEKILHKQVIDYLNTNDLLSKNQDGFRPDRGTIDSLSKLTNNIYNSLNKSLCTTAIFLDFKKAFDTLDHSIMIKKLAKLGFDNNSSKIIENYLQNRQQCTKANGLISDSAPITCGIPQGSVLGPLLFLIYINDLSHSLNSLNCQHYADDTVLYIAHNPHDVNVENTINKDLDNIAEWCVRNKLSLNAKKTKAMTFANKALANILIHPSLTISNNLIMYTPTYNYLGLHLDNMLDFKKQVDTIAHKLEYKSYMFRRIRNNMTEDAAKKVLKSMILPIADYGDLIYGMCIKTHLWKLQLVINKALRTCLRNKGTTNTEKLLKAADINYLEDRREQHLMQKAFDVSLDIIALDRRIIRTRQHDERLLKVTRPKNPIYRRSIEYRVAIAWNKLDNSIRAYKSREQFKQWNDGKYKDKLKLLPDLNNGR